MKYSEVYNIKVAKNGIEVFMKEHAILQCLQSSAIGSTLKRNIVKIYIYIYINGSLNKWKESRPRLCFWSIGNCSGLLLVDLL